MVVYTISDQACKFEYSLALVVNLGREADSRIQLKGKLTGEDV